MVTKSTFTLPFNEAARFFQAKLNIPTARWDDLWQGQHAKGFMVAGAIRAELLADFRAAIEKSVAGGMTLHEFREQFDTIVQKHGWSYNGGRNWRSALIYDTNVTTAYQAGRWQQFVESGATHLMYRHADGVLHPRPLHVALHGTVRPIDDPFWKTHYPPNGWGCKCRAVIADAEEETGVPASASDPKTIDKGWAYNVGEAGFGSPAEWAPDQPDKWLPLGRDFADDWETLGLPKRLPKAATATLPGSETLTREAMVDAVKQAIGGESAFFAIDGNSAHPFVINVNAEFLGQHLKLDRGRYLPYLREVVEQPQEVWLRFEKHAQTGKVRLGMQLLRAVETTDGKTMIMGAQVDKGMLEGWTFFGTDALNYINKQRWGKLIVGGKE
jgi:SPP1 gp7 family putative phage head morphogenesis protein